MRTDKGITLTSLIIYVVAMLIVVSLISVLTGYFYQNVEISSQSDQAMKQYTQFNSYFSNDIAKSSIKIIEAQTIGEEPKRTSYITFSNKNTYTFSEETKSIYRNDIRICEMVDLCLFRYELQDGKYTVRIEFKSGSFTRTGDHAIVYTIKDQ